MDFLMVLAIGLTGISVLCGLDLLMTSRHEKMMQEIDELLAVLDDKESGTPSDLGQKSDE